MKRETFEFLKRFGEVTFWLAVLCALLFSFSGWQVQWLKEAFSSSGQLVFRAASALIVSVLWLGIVYLIDRKKKHNVDHTPFDLGKYDKKFLVATVLCRPFFNLFFILAITAETATIALMILLFVKMLTNVVFSAFAKDDNGNRKIPNKKEIFGYLLVTLGIVVYGLDKPGMFDWVLLFAIGSGFLEGLRIELLKKLSVSSKDKPVFSIFEFAGMLVVALVMLAIFMIFSGGSLFSEDFSGITWHALFSMITLPITSVIILSIDYYLSTRMATGKYSAILATELGFAGVVNYIFLRSPFGILQVFGLLISMVAIIFIKLSSEKKK